MKKIFCFISLVFIIMPFYLHGNYLTYEPDKKILLVVLPFENKIVSFDTNITITQPLKLMDIVIKKVQELNYFSVIEKRLILNKLNEINYLKLKEMSIVTAISLAKELGAQAFLIPSIKKFYIKTEADGTKNSRKTTEDAITIRGVIEINIRIINVEDGSIISLVSGTGSDVVIGNYSIEKKISIFKLSYEKELIIDYDSLIISSFRNAVDNAIRKLAYDMSNKYNYPFNKRFELPKPKSATKATLLAFIPGAGELYLDNKTAAKDLIGVSLLGGGGGYLLINQSRTWLKITGWVFIAGFVGNYLPSIFQAPSKVRLYNEYRGLNFDISQEKTSNSKNYNYNLAYYYKF